jgi:hypothetical protein
MIGKLNENHQYLIEKYLDAPLFVFEIRNNKGLYSFLNFLRYIIYLYFLKR